MPTDFLRAVRGYEGRTKCLHYVLPPTQVLREGLRGLQALPLGWEEAEAAGRLAQALGRAGRRVPIVDLLIAAAARQNDCEVWHAGDEHYAIVGAVGGPPERNLREARRS